MSSPRKKPKWVGWVMDLATKPFTWVIDPETERETFERCMEALNERYPPDEPEPSGGSRSKVPIPIGQRPIQKPSSL